MKKTVIFEGGVNKVSTLSDGSLSINIHTQELPEEIMMRIFQLRKKPGMVLLSTDDKITEEELKAVEEFTTDFEFTGKTPSQRLRAVMYRVWEGSPKAKEFEFSLWYDAQMNKIIEKYKTLIDGFSH
jgi:hypothetical protein